MLTLPSTHMYVCRLNTRMLSYKTFKVVFGFTFLFCKCKKFEVNCRRDRAEKVVGLLARYITGINKTKLIVTIETKVALATRNNKQNCQPTA